MVLNGKNQAAEGEVPGPVRRWRKHTGRAGLGVPFTTRQSRRIVTWCPEAGPQDEASDWPCSGLVPALLTL